VLVDSFFNDRRPVNPLSVVQVVRKDKYVFHTPIPEKNRVLLGFGNEKQVIIFRTPRNGRITKRLRKLARLLLIPFFYKLQEVKVQSDSLVRFPNTSEDNKHVCEVDVLASFECVWLRANWFEAAAGLWSRELAMPVSTRRITGFNRLTY
jgi:hypothetical protein